MMLTGENENVKDDLEMENKSEKNWCSHKKTGAPVPHFMRLLLFQSASREFKSKRFY
jgi:hypothetical protein